MDCGEKAPSIWKIFKKAYKERKYLLEEMKIVPAAAERRELKENISEETKAILSFMTPCHNFYRNKYTVSNVALFDILLTNYLKNKRGNEVQGDTQPGLGETIDSALAAGRAFFIFKDGEEYVAIPSVKHMTADSLVK